MVNTLPHNNTIQSTKKWHLIRMMIETMHFVIDEFGFWSFENVFIQNIASLGSPKMVKNPSDRLESDIPTSYVPTRVLHEEMYLTISHYSWAKVNKVHYVARIVDVPTYTHTHTQPYIRFLLPKTCNYLFLQRFSMFCAFCFVLFGALARHVPNYFCVCKTEIYIKFFLVQKLKS